MIGASVLPKPKFFAGRSVRPKDSALGEPSEAIKYKFLMSESKNNIASRLTKSNLVFRFTNSKRVVESVED